MSGSLAGSTTFFLRGPAADPKGEFAAFFSASSTQAGIEIALRNGAVFGLIGISSAAKL